MSESEQPSNETVEEGADEEENGGEGAPEEENGEEGAGPETRADSEGAGDRGGRGRFRDDPLSMFLAVAAVLLGLMYYLEQAQIDSLEDANMRAQKVGVAQLDLDGCVTEAAGKQGTTLVVACKSTADDAARRATGVSPDISGFESVLFVGSDRRLLCGVDPGGWPDSCKSQEHPAIEEDRPGS